MDNTIGFLVFETSSIKLISVISGEAILYAGHLSFSKKSMDVLSNTEANHGNLLLSKNLVIFSIHPHGVCASL